MLGDAVRACGGGRRERVCPWRRAEYPRTYRFFRLNTINYYGNDACARFKSQCDCCEPLYMRFHIKEKKHQDEIKQLVQSKDIDVMFRGKRHDVHFDMVCTVLTFLPWPRLCGPSGRSCLCLPACLLQVAGTHCGGSSSSCTVLLLVSAAAVCEGEFWCLAVADVPCHLLTWAGLALSLSQQPAAGPVDDVAFSRPGCVTAAGLTGTSTSIVLEL